MTEIFRLYKGYLEFYSEIALSVSDLVDFPRGHAKV